MGLSAQVAARVEGALVQEQTVLFLPRVACRDWVLAGETPCSCSGEGGGWSGLLGVRAFVGCTLGEEGVLSEGQISNRSCG